MFNVQSSLATLSAELIAMPRQQRDLSVVLMAKLIQKMEVRMPEVMRRMAHEITGPIPAPVQGVRVNSAHEAVKAGHDSGRVRGAARG
jgi:hypothetical protein